MTQHPRGEMDEIPEDIDWRKILGLYMDYVAECEGITFLGGGDESPLRRDLTVAEDKALVELRDEIVSQWASPKAPTP